MESWRDRGDLWKLVDPTGCDGYSKHVDREIERELKERDNMTLPNPVQRAAEERAARIASGEEWAPRRYSPVPPGVTFTRDERDSDLRANVRTWAVAILGLLLLLALAWALVEFYPRGPM